MHELSIAVSLIDMATIVARAEGSTTISRLNIRVGLLSGVVTDALLFSFQVAAEGTPCEGAKLSIEEVPLTVMCPKCNEVKALAVQYHFSCPTCGSPTPQVVSGQELELVSIVIESAEVAV